MNRANWLILLCLASGFGCAWADISASRDRCAEARETHQRCVDEASDPDQRCLETRGAMQDVCDRYEEKSRRSWGCEHSVDGCDPTGAR